MDPDTGKLVFEETGAGYTNAKGKWVPRTTTTTRLGNVDDAYTLSSGTPIESVYASHSNKLKGLANSARKASLQTKSLPYSPSAKIAYAAEVASLSSKLNTALQNAPRERQAQLLANATVAAKRAAYPDMDPAELKKVKGQALTTARIRTGADKERVTITPTEWQAIQAGAITNSRLTRILDNADLDEVKKLATPRTAPAVSGAAMARARNMLASGYTQSEISDMLGIPASTLNDAILKEDR